MAEKTKPVAFATLLASSIHDMKNSLGMLLATLEQLTERCAGAQCDTAQEFTRLQYETRRVNNDLIRLLALYRLENEHYAPNFSYYSVFDFIEDEALTHGDLLRQRRIELQIDCPPELGWVFDRDLVAGVIDNILNNALRYTSGRIRIAAGKHEGYLRLSIEDDGKGYPEQMLTTARQGLRGIDFESGSTGLGLYFATVVAGAHLNKGCRGYIRLSNDTGLGGGCFELYLP